MGPEIMGLYWGLIDGAFDFRATLTPLGATMR